MANRSPGTVLPHLRHLLAAADQPGDAQLLGQFLGAGSEDAFASLVRRHGPMVLAVCRRLLAEPHDAEDAFQAAFLVLVRKASSLSRPERLGNWLYGVAYRVALKMRGQSARRHRREQPLVVDMPVEGAVADLVWRELRPALDEELHRLPEKYRAPVVLCYLEGFSKRQAARQLGWAEGTLSTRLHRARLLLRGRLARRGLGLSAGVVAVALSQGAAAAAVPANLAAATAAAASLVTAGRAASVPASVLAVVEGVLRAMWWSKLKVVAAVLLALGVVVAGLGSAALDTPAEQPPAQARTPAARPAAESPKARPSQVRSFALGKNVREITWSPDGKLLASRATRSERRPGGDDDARDWYDTVQVWDAATGQEVVSLGEVKNSGLVAMGFAPDGATLALSFFRQIQEGARIELWQARTGHLLKTISMDYGRITPRFAFTPDGKSLAVLYAGDQGRDRTTGDLNGGARLFDLATGKVLRAFHGHKHLAISLAVSPDGKLLATGGSQHDHDVCLWDLAGGKLMRVLKSGAIVPAVAFSPDARTLAGGQGDGRVVLWHLATGQELRALASGPNNAFAVGFSPDGRLVAAAGLVDRDAQRSFGVWLWSASTGKLLRSWQNTGASFSFAPDGTLLAILGKDGVVRLWPIRGLAAAAIASQADFGFGKLIDQLLKDRKTDDQAAEWLYVAAIGRFPDERERKLLTTHLASGKDRREAMLDVVWALLNSREFRAHLDVLNRNDPRRTVGKKQQPGR
jgi:RNA polymerase sigma factor (sigma-70 family)